MLVRCCNVVAHEQQMGFLKVRSRLVADPCCEKHLHLQTITVRVYLNIFGMKNSGNQKTQSGLCTFKSAATSSDSRAVIVLAKQPGYSGVSCAMMVLHKTFACLACAMQRLSHAGASSS